MIGERLVVTPITPGLVDQEFAVVGEMPVTFRGSRVVFAISEKEVKVVIKIPAALQGAEREWIGLTKNRQAGIPVPEPIILGLTDSGLPCIVLERLYGKPLFLHHDKDTRVQLGQIVKQMHSRVQTEGIEWLESGMVDYSYYDKQVNIWRKNQSQIEGDRVDTQYFFQLLSLPMIDYCTAVKPVFNHNDIHDGQIIRSVQNELTLIDFEDWTEDRPLNDIGYYLFHCLRTNDELENFKNFINGYLGGESLSETEKQALIYNLLFISTRAVTKFLNHKMNYLETARVTHQKVLKFIDNETLWKVL